MVLHALLAPGAACIPLSLAIKYVYMHAYIPLTLAIKYVRYTCTLS